MTGRFRCAADDRSGIGQRAVCRRGRSVPVEHGRHQETKPRDKNHRDVIGQVMLPDDTPAVGAVVKLKNLHSLEVHSFIIQTDGKYIFRISTRTSTMSCEPTSRT